LNLLFASCEAGFGKADSKIEGWEQSEQTKEMTTKQALQAKSAFSTSIDEIQKQNFIRDD